MSFRVSIVIPVFNEETALPMLFNELDRMAASLGPTSRPIEFVLVDDGSRDRSWELIAEHCRKRPGWVGLHLSRNFGHQAALIAGLEAARGEAVISMDADLQDPPELIPQMLELHQDGYDVVYTTRRDRGAESWLKRVTAQAFYLLLEKLSGVTVPRNSGDFRLLSRRALTELLRLHETHRFLRGLVPWIGFPQKQLFYDRANRVAGDTHYSWIKMTRLALDGIAAMSAAPLRLASALAPLAFLAFAGYVGFVLEQHFRRGRPLPPGWLSLMAAITVFGALQLLMLAVLGEYLGRVHEQSKNRPLYIVREMLGHNPESRKSPGSA